MIRKLKAFAIVVSLSLVAVTSYAPEVQSAAVYNQIKKLKGLHERKHRKRLQKILGVNPAKVPWCGYILKWAVKAAGRRPPKGYAAARSWKRYGKRVSLKNARRGDIMVLRNRRGNHVTVFSHRSKGRYCGLGGNQSNRVKLSCYRSSSIVAIRR